MRYPGPSRAPNLRGMLDDIAGPAPISGRVPRPRPRPTFRIAGLLAAGALLLLPHDASAIKRRAFVTSVTGNGNLASWPGATGSDALERADSICRNQAAAGLLPNATTYRAWISTAATDAYCHVQGLTGSKSSGCNGAPLPGGGPWFLANGVSNYTGTLDQMTGPEAVMYRPVSLDENQDPAPSVFLDRQIWTGTGRQGSAQPTNCADWSSSASGSSGTTGDALGVGYRFSDAFSLSCDTLNHLLCLEPGASETVTLGWSPGALAFVTSATGSGDLGSWPQADGLSGINAGYRICRNLAAAAHLPAPESFVPWLSTTAVDAVARLTTDGPFRRVDGYAVANDVAVLVSGAPSNSLHVLENGTYIGTVQDWVWTGTHPDGTANGDLCLNWTDGGDVEYARAGDANIGRAGEWTDVNGYHCAVQFRLYCLANVITLFWDGFEKGSTARWSATAP